MDKKTIDLDPEPKDKEIILLRGNYCPKCHKGTLIYEEGCVKCSSCTFTIC